MSTESLILAIIIGNVIGTPVGIVLGHLTWIWWNRKPKGK